MSLKFAEPVNEAAESMIEEIFGKPKATDLEHKTFLVDGINQSVPSDRIEELMRVAGQGLVMKNHQVGDVEVLDGTCYRATERGWVRDV